MKENDQQIRYWNEGSEYHQDVREMLETGGEPYPYIMDSVNQIITGQTLVVHSLFEPKPLISQIKQMGFHVRCDHVGMEHWTLSITLPD